MNSLKMRPYLRPTFLVLALFFLLIAPEARAEGPDWRSQGIVYNASSPQAKVHTVPIRAVKMGEGFWSARMRTNVEQSIPSLLQLLESHGVVDNFRRLSSRKAAGRRGPLYTDSDIYKWMEAVAFVLQSGDQPALRAKLGQIIDEVVAAQEPSGYLNTYYVQERESLRFTEMHRSHELYCLGHLLQAGIAYYRATGETKLLDVGRKYADYLVQNFGPDKKPALTGHPELEMALVELYRTTGERRYLEFAGYLLGGDRMRLNLTDDQVRYMFSGIPFTSHRKFEGHAVRALYASSGATDYFAETGDEKYLRALAILWRDLVDRKMYVTGGVGSRAAGESFGDPYELPNATAYAESCAAIANMMWNWRLLLVSGEARFADVLERSLYNGVNSGMSLSGKLYCYRSPLESAGEDVRASWYDTTCCPPNLERTFASIPGYLYGTSPTGVYLHLYHSSTLDWRLEDGTGLSLVEETDYPWNDTISIMVKPAQPTEFSVFLRIPGWTQKAKVTVNGQPAQPPAKPGEYLEIHRVWKTDDKIRLTLDMSPRVVTANPRVRDDLGRIALERGPLVYCLEQLDLVAQDSVSDISLPLGPVPARGFTTEFRPDMMGGIVVIKHKGIAASKPFSEEPLYRAWSKGGSKGSNEVELTFIPYYAWANRLPSPMEVWVPYTAESPLSKAR